MVPVLPLLCVAFVVNSARRFIVCLALASFLCVCVCVCVCFFFFFFFCFFCCFFFCFFVVVFFFFFVVVVFFFSPFSITITSLGEERAGLCAFRAFICFTCVGLCLFPLPLGVRDWL